MNWNFNMQTSYWYAIYNKTKNTYVSLTYDNVHCAVSPHLVKSLNTAVEHLQQCIEKSKNNDNFEIRKIEKTLTNVSLENKEEGTLKLLGVIRTLYLDEYNYTIYEMRYSKKFINFLNTRKKYVQLFTGSTDTIALKDRLTIEFPDIVRKIKKTSLFFDGGNLLGVPHSMIVTADDLQFCITLKLLLSSNDMTIHIIDAENFTVIS